MCDEDGGVRDTGAGEVKSDAVAVEFTPLGYKP
jgi:hypothetical protein